MVSRDVPLEYVRRGSLAMDRQILKNPFLRAGQHLGTEAGCVSVACAVGSGNYRYQPCVECPLHVSLDMNLLDTWHVTVLGMERFGVGEVVAVQSLKNRAEWRRAKIVAIAKQKVAGVMRETYSVVYFGPRNSRRFSRCEMPFALLESRLCVCRKFHATSICFVDAVFIGMLKIQHQTRGWTLILHLLK